MATPVYRRIHDQNLHILYNGTTTGENTDAAKPAKKGALGGRKALNDISNSSNVLKSTKMENSKNVISIGKDPVSGKGKLLKAPEKGKLGGRKALSDLTNSVNKPSSQQVSKTSRKLDTVAENFPSSVVEEGFLHNHQKCIKAQTKAVDMDFFLKTVGLNNGNSNQSAVRTLQSSSKKAERDWKILELEEIIESPFGSKAPSRMKSELYGDFTPVCRSPKSPKPPYMNWQDDRFCDMTLMESP